MNAAVAPALCGKTVAVAVSGGQDSMALLHFMLSVKDKHRLSVVCINVEHGIRGESSVRDSAFVKSQCEKLGVPLIFYSVNAPRYAEENKLSLEQAARILRYDCFFNAINSHKCDAVVTAHHSSDYFESALFNLFRGTGIKGLISIKDYDGKIFRPFINVTKREITDYIDKNNIPFVTDESNFQDDYSRNFLRLNVIPKIKEIFPEAEKSVLRLAETLSAEDAYLDRIAENSLHKINGENGYRIELPQDNAILSRAVILALKDLGLKKDYEKVHVSDVCSLAEKQTGKIITLPLGIRAIREYDRICIYKPETADVCEIPFKIGETAVNGQTVKVEFATSDDLKDGLYADYGKIPDTAVIRTKKAGDGFTKFGGGTKSLSDYLTDRKIPLKDRDKLLLIANGSDVLAIFGVAISDKIKVDDKTEKTVKLNLQRT